MQKTGSLYLQRIPHNKRSVWVHFIKSPCIFQLVISHKKTYFWKLKGEIEKCVDGHYNFLFFMVLRLKKNQLGPFSGIGPLRAEMVAEV